MNKYLKCIIIILALIITSCGTKKNIPQKEFVSYYYQGEEIIQKIDSITNLYKLPNLSDYENWTKSYYVGVHKGDSVQINTFYITVNKNDRLYIFNINEILRNKYKELKFLIN